MTIPKDHLELKPATYRYLFDDGFILDVDGPDDYTCREHAVKVYNAEHGGIAGHTRLIEREVTLSADDEPTPSLPM